MEKKSTVKDLISFCEKGDKTIEVMANFEKKHQDSLQPQEMPRLWFSGGINSGLTWDTQSAQGTALGTQQQQAGLGQSITWVGGGF